jgi:hypothetical protein
VALRIEDLDVAQRLVRLRAPAEHGASQPSRKHCRVVGRVSHGLAAQGILKRPLRMRNYLSWREKSSQGVNPE